MRSGFGNRRKLRHGVYGLDRIHAHDDQPVAGRSELHVDRRTKPTVAYLHHPRVVAGGAHPRAFLLAAVALLGRSDFRQLLRRLADAFLALRLILEGAKQVASVAQVFRTPAQAT